MKLESAFEIQAELLDLFLPEQSAFHGAVAHAYAAHPVIDEQHASRDVGIGIKVLPGGEFGIAVHLQARTDDAWQAAKFITEKACGETYIEYIGRVRAQSDIVSVFSDSPLMPGISVGHPKVTAGTIGAFITLADDSRIHILSNNHILAACDRGCKGDAIIQPGPSDGGLLLYNRIGALASTIPLGALLPPNVTVDAATCVLDEGMEWNWGRVHDLVAPLTVTPEMMLEEEVVVAKEGKESHHTQGWVDTLNEGLWVDYSKGRFVKFEGQMLIRSSDGRFSTDGDSGSLVYRPGTRQPVGLLVAGTDSGVSYVTPLEPVLTGLRATLAI